MTTPNHTGLFLRTEPEALIESWPAGTQPKQLHFLETRMVENALDDLRANALLLIRFVHDHIPNRGTIDKIRQYPPETDEMIPVPGTQRHIGVAKHVAGIIERPPFGPRRLLKQRQ